MCVFPLHQRLHVIHLYMPSFPSAFLQFSSHLFPLRPANSLSVCAFIQLFFYQMTVSNYRPVKKKIVETKRLITTYSYVSKTSCLVAVCILTFEGRGEKKTVGQGSQSSRVFVLTGLDLGLEIAASLFSCSHCLRSHVLGERISLQMELSLTGGHNKVRFEIKCIRKTITGPCSTQ